MNKNKFKFLLTALLLLSTINVFTGITVSAPPVKSLYLIANHWSAAFDAWNINSDGTVGYQATYTLSSATDPAGISMDESSATLFITSEFSLAGFELVDATTMTSIGTAPGASDLAGIDVDDANDVIYAVERWTNQLYIYDWNPTTLTATQRVGSPFSLPGCAGAFGIALDETTNTLWVADSPNSIARAYDATTLVEDTSRSFTPSHMPIDIAVDRVRGYVYTVSMNYGAWTPFGAGSVILSKWDTSTNSETTVGLGQQGVGVSVDETTGYVYVTLSPFNAPTTPLSLTVWDPSISPFTLIDSATFSGSPAGIYVPQTGVSYNPLNLEKADDVADGDTVDVGEQYTYTISYENDNAYDVSNVVITDTLPPEVDFIDASTGYSYDALNRLVTWNIGYLVAGTSGSVWLTVEVAAGTQGGTIITNDCSIDCDQTGTAYASEDTEVTPNLPPDCSNAHPSEDILWPPNHKMAKITIEGVTDPDGDPVTITVTGVWQDEPTEGLGDGDVSPDAVIYGDYVEVRAERSGIEDGRVYHIYFTAEDGKGGVCECEVIVGVPHDKKDTPVDGGSLFDSTLP